MRTIRASEINSFLYCQRAWSYQLKGKESSNQLELDAGREQHANHYHMVTRIGCAKAVAFMLMLLSIVLFAFIIANRLPI